MTVHANKPLLGTILLVVLLASPFAALAGDEATALSLSDAIDLALGNNREILKADQDIIKAKGAVTEYRSDAFPQITFNFEWKHNILVPTDEMDLTSGLSQMLIPIYTQLQMAPPASEGPTEFDLVPPDEFTFNVGLTQNIYTFGRLHNAIKLAKVYLEMAQTVHSATTQDVVLQVSSAYYDVLYTKELVLVAQKALEQSEQTRDNLKRKYEQGLVSEFDYLRSEVEVSNRRPSVIQSRTGVELAEKNLKRLLNMDLSTPITITSTFRNDPIPVNLADARTEALGNREEVKVIDLQYEASRREKNLYISNMLPAISGFSDYTWTGSKQTGFGGDEEMEWYNFWTAGLRFHAPIFDGLRNYGKMKQAKAEMQKSVYDRMELEDGIRLEVENLYTTLETIGEELVAYQKAVDFAGRTVHLAKLRFDNGLGTQLDVLDAETAMILAENNLASAKYRYNVQLANFERSLGRYANMDRR